MTDMRNFGSSNDIRAESAFVDSDAVIKENYALDESGEGLGGFHRNPEELEETGGRSKAISALVVVLMVGAVGAYAYSMYTPQKEVVATEDLARPSAPTNTAAMTPPPPVVAPEAASTAAGDSLAAAPSDTNMSTPAPAAAPLNRQAAAPRVATPAPVTRTAPVAADPTPLSATPSPAVTPPVAPVENQAAAIPEPVSPTPPASAVAGNPPLNVQSAPVEAAPVTPAAPVEAAPAPEPAQPAAPAEATPAQ